MPKCIRETISYANKASVPTGAPGTFQSASPWFSASREFSGKLTPKQREKEYEEMKKEVDDRLRKKVSTIKSKRPTHV